MKGFRKVRSFRLILKMGILYSIQYIYDKIVFLLLFSDRKSFRPFATEMNFHFQN